MNRYVLFLSTLLIPSIAAANDLPPIKAGLWSVTTTTDGKRSETIKQCMNQEVFGKFLTSGQKMMGGACEELKIKNNGGVYSSNLRCTIMGSKMNSQAEVKGDFQTSYTATTNTTMNPPMMGMGSTSQVAKATYLGDCGDMKPGEMVMADGRRMNALEMMDSMPNVGDMMKNMPDMSQMQQQMQQLQRQMQGMNQ